MHNEKIAAIGAKDSVTAFAAAGADVFSPQDKEETAELIKRLVKENYALILIAEDKAEGVTDLIYELKSRVYPVILPIPASGGATGLGMRGLKYNVEKAIGMDIILDKEGSE